MPGQSIQWYAGGVTYLCLSYRGEPVLNKKKDNSAIIYWIKGEKWARITQKSILKELEAVREFLYKED